MANIIHPFHGRPPTRQDIGPDGKLRFTVTPRELTPRGAKAADALASMCMVALAVTLFHIGNADYVMPPATLVLLILATTWLWYTPFSLLWRFLLKQETRIEMTPERFSVLSWLGCRHFDRTLPHKFAVIVHDTAKAEEEKHTLEIRQAQAAGRIIGKTRYYGESFHIVFEYVGQRHDVLTVFGQKEALAVAARLKACDGVLDQQAGLGEGLALNPEEQWTPGPGDIGP